MNFFARICFLGAALAGVGALLEFVNVMTRAESAPQAASGYAGAIALAVIPYCLARCAEKVFAPLSVAIRAEKADK